MTRRLAPDQQGLDEAAAILRRGGLVAMPTETVYGLAANALDPVAVARIFEAKRRPSFDPLIVHLPSADRAFALATSVPEAARLLAATFWPGPLTLVLPRAATIPDIVAAELPTVGLRVPAHPVARQLLERVGIPLAAPSANLFGFVSPTSAAHVLDGLDGRIDALIDGGPCAHGLESTVVAFDDDRPIILRHGAITREQITALCGDVGEGARILERPLAPGQLARHYATRTPLRLFERSQRLLALLFKRGLRQGTRHLCLAHPLGCSLLLRLKHGRTPRAVRFERDLPHERAQSPRDATQGLGAFGSKVFPGA
jgi:L-threonylcarbamoyladenylate synthase